MAFGCFTPHGGEKAKNDDEYSGRIDSTTSVAPSAAQLPDRIDSTTSAAPSSAPLSSSHQTSQNPDKKKKHFWSLGGKKGKKLAALKEASEQQLKTIEDLKETAAAEKASYEAEIARLQSQLNVTKTELEVEKEMNQKLHASKAEILRNRAEEKKMVNENMTLVEKMLAPAQQQDTSDVSSELDVVKKAKKKNSMNRKQKRNQKNEIKVASEIGEEVVEP